MPATLPATMRHVSPVRSRAPLAVLGVVALLVAACGSGGPSPSSVAGASAARAVARRVAVVGHIAVGNAVDRGPAADRRHADHGPPRPRRREGATRRSSSTACRPRCGSGPCPTGAAGSSSPSRTGRCGWSRTASCRPSRTSTSRIGSRRAASAGCSGVAFPPGFGDRAPARLRPLLGPQRRHDDRVLRRPGRRHDASTRRPSA